MNQAADFHPIDKAMTQKIYTDLNSWTETCQSCYGGGTLKNGSNAAIPCPTCEGKGEIAYDQDVATTQK